MNLKEPKMMETSRKSDSEEEEENYESSLIKPEDMIFNPESQMRNWLKSRGKDHCIHFQDEELR